MALTLTGRVTLGVAGAAAIFFGARYGIEHYAPKPAEKVPSIPRKVDLPVNVPPPVAVKVAKQPATVPVANASSQKPASKPEKCIRQHVWAWAAQFGMFVGNGGISTQPGSINDRRGICVDFIRQDDVAQNQASLIAFAEELAGGNPHPKNGVHFVAIMGDGGHQFLDAINSTLERLGPEYKAEVIGSAGYSVGEDKCMAPPACNKDKQQCRGLLCTAYVPDGDWNIMQKLGGDNEIPNNPDFRTYDANAINWVNASTYLDAAEKYIAGYGETRSVVKNGKLTGETIDKKVDCVCTWTPGDVNIAKKRGGLEVVASTKEFRYQMPNVIIGIHKWLEANPTTVEAYLEGIFDGGDVVMGSEEGFRQGAELAALVFNEETPEYWAKYAKGVVERDIQGLLVPLGGSKVNNLADNLHLFGLLPGSLNLFEITYRGFGTIAHEQYPELVHPVGSVADILNTRFIKAIASRTTVPQEPEIPVFHAAQPVTRKMAQKSYRIPFETGKATFTPAAELVLQKLLDSVAIAGSLAGEIHGHTDDVGNDASNMVLSQKRAFAVRDWLNAKSPQNFPRERFVVKHFGETVPLEPNDSNESRAKNRRVEIVLGETS